MGLFCLEYYKPYSWDSKLFRESSWSWVLLPSLFVFFITIALMGILGFSDYAISRVLLVEYFLGIPVFYTFGLSTQNVQTGEYEFIRFYEIKWPTTFVAKLSFFLFTIVVPLHIIAHSVSRVRKFGSKHAYMHPTFETQNDQFN